MALILAIDTALDKASVCLAEDEQVISVQENSHQKDHASWIHEAIRMLFDNTGKQINQTDYVAVSNGPGSYTGLRVGLSTAKGICFALNKPLITVNTLAILANAVRQEAADLICPMIDARRMEVYYGVYDKKLNELEKPSAKILHETSFERYLNEHQVLFTGNGALKFEQICNNQNRASFSYPVIHCSQMITLAHELIRIKKFSDLAYVEPLYVKEFYTKGSQPLI